MAFDVKQPYGKIAQQPTVDNVTPTGPSIRRIGLHDGPIKIGQSRAHAYRPGHVYVFRANAVLGHVLGQYEHTSPANVRGDDLQLKSKTWIRLIGQNKIREGVNVSFRKHRTHPLFQPVTLIQSLGHQQRKRGTDEGNASPQGRVSEGAKINGL